MSDQPAHTSWSFKAILLLILPFIVTTGSGALNQAAHAATNVTPQIAVGTEHTCALQSDGSVYCWGRNHYGQLGIGEVTATAHPNPLLVAGLSDVVQIQAGVSHTCALTSNGHAYCWGYNFHGQLGDGTNTDRTTPVRVTNLGQITEITIGGFHTCALLTDKTVHCWGINDGGQLGNGSTVSENTPVPVTGLTNVSALTSSNAHTCALLDDTTARCWGFNASGQLGDGTTTPRLTPVAVLTSGTDQTSNLLSGIVQLSAGGAHTCALLNDSSVLCWGSNASGQLGDGTATGRSNPVAVTGVTDGVTDGVEISAGVSTSCVRHADGTVSCWGSNSQGVLGDNSTTDSNVPVATQLPAITATQIATGGFHSCALLSDDTVRCWGSGGSGRIGDGETQDRLVPTPVLVSGTSGDYFSVRVAVVTPPPPPAAQPQQPSPAETLALDCRFDRLTVNAPVTCAITGGPAGSELSWQATSNPIIAEGQVLLDADGAGQFEFTLTADAAEKPLFVALIGWLEPVGVGIVSANTDETNGVSSDLTTPPLPASIPAGEGGTRHNSVWYVFLVLGLVAARTMRQQATRHTP